MTEQKNSTDRFNDDAIKKYSKNSYKSREQLVNMPIKDFLDMASPGHDSSKESDLPFLQVHGYDDETIHKVNGHEGRHRARELQSNGYTHMPVRIIHRTLK